MSDKPKRQQTEAQLANLEKGNLKYKTPSERKEIARRGAIAANKVKAEKVKREESKEYSWEVYGQKWLEYIDQYGDAKTKADVLKALFPNEKQVNDINFKNLNPDVIIETVEMRQKAEKYTKKLLND